MGLVSLGYEPGEVVSILANTRKEWVYADLGALGAAGVVQRHLPDRRGRRRSSTCCRIPGPCSLFVEDEEQLDKVLEVRGGLPRAAQDHRDRHEGPARLQRPAA